MSERESNEYGAINVREGEIVSPRRHARVQPATILLIAGDPGLRRVLHEALPDHGFRLHDAINGKQGLREAISSNPDLILVDLDQPDGDGLDVIRQIRARTDAPILVLGDRDNEPRTVAALELGADDYVTKPMSVPGLVAHLRAVLRPVAPSRLMPHAAPARVKKRAGVGVADYGVAQGLR